MYTHHYNKEIKPTPGVGEVLGKAQCYPFDQHLNEEYDSEDPVHVVENILQLGTVLQVYILCSQGQ